MNNEFDFKNIGKRMPYTTPDKFLDEIENNVWESIKDEPTPSVPKRSYRLWYSISGGLIAASIALVLYFNIFPIQHKTVDFNSCEKAFSELSSVDQDYLFTVYQNDLFINE